MKAICTVKEPSVIAFEDVYEEGDRWEKVQGCEVCPVENRKKCCGNCEYLTDEGRCGIHGMSKPYKCSVYPTPVKHKDGCALVFKSVKGSMKGKVRRVNQPRDMFE